MSCNKDFTTSETQEKSYYEKFCFPNFSSIPNFSDFKVEWKVLLQVPNGVLVCKMHTFFDEVPQGLPSGFEK